MKRRRHNAEASSFHTAFKMCRSSTGSLSTGQARPWRRRHNAEASSFHTAFKMCRSSTGSLSTGQARPWTIDETIHVNAVGAGSCRPRRKEHGIRVCSGSHRFCSVSDRILRAGFTENAEDAEDVNSQVCYVAKKASPDPEEVPRRVCRREPVDPRLASEEEACWGGGVALLRYRAQLDGSGEDQLGGPWRPFQYFGFPVPGGEIRRSAGGPTTRDEDRGIAGGVEPCLRNPRRSGLTAEETTGLTGRAPRSPMLTGDAVPPCRHPSTGTLRFSSPSPLVKNKK
ncbi:hypothetical protein NDU88_000655 [Pleurodeles waltl]|uniref:Uncharacterized protein n=1 Tax=Pleurodeles waltl TaxID=8319 RepID=A0AAV7USD6_PLEWA|nr:hypothetical protein NDU88_000655 [Pleurodeles waltl]